MGSEVNVTQGDIMRQLDRAIERIMGVEIEAMNGDNLAVTLCSYFDRDDDSEPNDNGWSESATNAYDEIKQEIAGLFVPVREAVQAFTAHRHAALLEGVRLGLEAAGERIRISPLYSSTDQVQQASFWTARDLVRALDPAAIIARRGEG